MSSKNNKTLLMCKTMTKLSHKLAKRTDADMGSSASNTARAKIFFHANKSPACARREMVSNQRAGRGKQHQREMQQPAERFP